MNIFGQLCLEVVEVGGLYVLIRLANLICVLLTLNTEPSLLGGVYIICLVQDQDLFRDLLKVVFSFFGREREFFVVLKYGFCWIFYLAIMSMKEPVAFGFELVMLCSIFFRSSSENLPPSFTSKLLAFEGLCLREEGFCDLPRFLVIDIVFLIFSVEDLFA